jgi:polygalacturonase
MNSWNIMDFGAVGDGVTDDVVAIQRAVDACAASGGGRVLIPAGRTVMAGSFELRSRVDFHVAEGATLRSATDIEAFPRRVFSQGEEAEKRLWIGAKGAEDITLSGKGTIDGHCLAFALGENEFIYTPTVRWRPAMTCFENVRRLSVSDLTFRNAANWTLHFSGCEDVSVKDVRIFNDLRFPNADGIDPDHCRRVRISGCHIVSADDCIVLKNTASFSQYGPCEDIEITDCRLESASAAFKIGSESHGDFRRIRMSDCVIERSNRGLAIQLRDGGSVEDVEFENIRINTKKFAPVWWGAGEAIYVTALPRNAETVVGTVRDVRFRDVHCDGENGVVVYGDPADRIRDITFERVRIVIRRHTQWPSGLLDLRPFQCGYLPNNADIAGEITPWGHVVRRTPAAFSFDGVEEVRLEGVSYSLPETDSVAWQAMHVTSPAMDVDGIRRE